MLVTVYITTKNRLQLLNRAVESVFSQTHPEVELIVVDDGSTDGTREFLQEQQDQGRLRCILQKESQGACVARNAAIAIATGEFITGMDDDDWFTEDRIEKFVKFWAQLSSDEQANISGLYADSIEFYPEGEELQKQRASRVSYEDLRKSNGVGNQVFAPKNRFVAIEGFDPEMPAWQDWDCWLRMAEKSGDFLNCGAMTYLQDASHDSERITAKDPKKIRTAHSRLCGKLGCITFREKLLLNKTLVDYRQVIPKASETLTTLFVGDVWLFMSCVKRMLSARAR
ncbi:glycosyltransferase family 2 protein [Corallincola spongiicola]|uniref:Glycosyltransferase n=1 Tax=Corallincola spongiicola TaxID=2520508 RepID=A0ABY1WSZ9_9GAMM|nr:glycosyltransferase [Corallincola spongiicola]TAA47753.1 glycosyltransferase [Corallincola spongiicola]